MFSCTCTHTSCYVMVIFLHLLTHVMLRYGYLGVGLGGVGWGNNVHVNLHTHVMLRYCYVLLHLHTHVVLRYGDLLLHLLTHVMLRYGYLGVGLGGVGWGNDVHVNLHTHVMLRYCYVLLHLHTHTSCYVMVIFSCTCSHTSCYAMVILGPLTPHRFLEELCKAVKAMKRF